MAYVHSKLTFVSIDAVDLSQYTKNTAFNRKADTHENTGYGKDAKTYNGGLLDGTVTISGDYNDAVAGPAATLEPLFASGELVAFVFRPAGTGTGKVQRTVDVIVAAYNESSPVGGNVQWTAELQMSDDVVTTTQP